MIEAPLRILRYTLTVILTTVLVGCTPRAITTLSDTSLNASAQRLFFATLRSPGQEGQIFGEARVPVLRYGWVDVSVPPTHKPGQLEWTSQKPNPEKEFAVTGVREFDGVQDFLHDLHRSQSETPSETLVFVHGYNTTGAESVLRLAQIQEDFELPDPSVLFSWPSAGVAAGYVYDRDSVLFARDDLVSVLSDLTRGHNKVFVVAHSMGSLLVMEALRQLKLEGNTRTLGNLTGVVLMSPDIDPDIFNRQANDLGKLPQPFVIFSSKNDRALSLSSLLTGRRPRVGVIANAESLGRTDVTVVDLSRFGSGDRLNHMVAATSSGAAAFLRSSVQVSSNGRRQFRNFVIEPAEAK